MTKARDPETPEEWRAAVNGARLYRALHDCKLYGLITGGPDVNAARCDEILEAGARRGYRPDSLDTLIAEYIGRKLIR